MKPYDEKAVCPKCLCVEIHSQWCEQPEKVWMPCEFAEQTRMLGGRYAEHIHRTCRRCSFSWLEAPRG